MYSLVDCFTRSINSILWFLLFLRKSTSYYCAWQGNDKINFARKTDDINTISKFELLLGGLISAYELIELNKFWTQSIFICHLQGSMPKKLRFKRKTAFETYKQQTTSVILIFLVKFSINLRYSTFHLFFFIEPQLRIQKLDKNEIPSKKHVTLFHFQKLICTKKC